MGSIELGLWGTAAGVCYQRQNQFMTAHVDEPAPTIGFDANKSSVIYGKSDTVQPSAFQTLIIIKV